jgi:DNA-directed RNA polymerase subunit RPC12/RpoP
MKPNYYCLTCGNEIFIDLKKLEEEDTTLNVKCRCGKNFILATKKVGDEYHAFTYEILQGKPIAVILENLLQNTKLPLTVQNEMIKLATLNRFEQLKTLIKKYYMSLSSNTKLVNFLAENLIY